MAGRAVLGRTSVRVCVGAWLAIAGVRDARAQTARQNVTTPPPAPKSDDKAASGASGNGGAGTDASKPEEPVDTSPKFIGLPIPIYNPQLDFALGAMAMLTYPLVGTDTVSPPSSTLAAGMISSNKSWFAMAGQQVFWAHDDNRATLVVGGGHFNSDFYGTGDTTDANIAFPLGTSGVFAMTKYLRRVWNRLYLGGKYQFSATTAVLDAPDEASETIKSYLPVEKSFRNSGFGAISEFDSRDNRFSATRGFYIPLNTMFFNTAFGGNTDYSVFDVAYNSYHDLHQKQLILAFRGFFQVASAGTPPHLLPTIGKGADLRGYATGRYRDYLFMAAQSELRWYFWKGLGAVVFAGIGSTTASFGELFQGTVLPSYGLGLRYMLHPKQRLVMRVDYGRGNEDGMFYFSVSESF